MGASSGLSPPATAELTSNMQAISRVEDIICFIAPCLPNRRRMHPPRQPTKWLEPPYARCHSRSDCADRCLHGKPGELHSNVLRTPHCTAAKPILCNQPPQPLDPRSEQDA